LPDEASLATMLAHELSHVVLGHRLDSQYAFFNELLVEDKDTFKHFGFQRTPDEENKANEKAMQLLNNSPYKAQLGNAGLFLQALQSRQKEVPNLISAHLGNRVRTCPAWFPRAAGSEAESAEDCGASDRRTREDGSMERQAGPHQEQTGWHIAEREKIRLK